MRIPVRRIASAIVPSCWIRFTFVSSVVSITPCFLLCFLLGIDRGGAAAPPRANPKSISPTTRSFQRTTRSANSRSVRLAPRNAPTIQSEAPYDPDGPVSNDPLDELNPTEEAIRASGALAGPLWPMSPANPVEWVARGLSNEQVAKLQAGARLFSKAMNQWNQGNWAAAGALFSLHLTQFPENPWSGESMLHLAEIAEANGRYGEAGAYYSQIIVQTSNDEEGPRYELRQKAKMCWASIDIQLGQLDAAATKLDDIFATERHWRRRTWAQYWAVRLGQMRRDYRLARACGAESLSAVLAQIGKKQAAQRVARALPRQNDGFSMAEVVAMAQRQGVTMKGFRATPEQMAQLPLPLIINCDWEMRTPTVPALETAKKQLTADQQLGTPDLKIARAFPASPLVKGGKAPKRQGYNPAIFRPTNSGHFLVVEKVDAKNRIVYVFNQHAGLRWKYTFDQLAHEWSGTGLVIADAPHTSMPRMMAPPRLTWLSDAQMSHIKSGGFTPVSKTGKGQSPANKPVHCSCLGNVGAPSWSINRATCNLFLSDTPMLIHNPYGPDMALSISYNTWDSQNFANRLGPKWSLCYQSVISTAVSGAVTVYMPDGREDKWTPDGLGGYAPPSGNYSTMGRLNTTNQGFVLTFQDDSQMEYDAKNTTSATEYYLSKIKDRFGNALTINYIGTGTGFRINYITNAAGISVANFHYGANGKIDVITNMGSGRTCQFLYDASNRLTSVTDMGGLQFTYTYDGDNNIISVTNVAKGTTWGLGWEMPEAAPGPYNTYPLYPAPTNPKTHAVAAPMGANMRLTLNNPDGTQAEFYYKANHLYPDSIFGANAYMWYVDENHYQPYWDALTGAANATNNSSASTLKTKWLATADIQSGEQRLAQTVFPVVKGTGNITEEYTYVPAGQNGTGLLNTITQHRTYGDTGYPTTYTYNPKGNIASVTFPLETGYPTANRMTWTYATNNVDVSSVTRTDYPTSGAPTVRTLVTYSNYFLHSPQDIVDGTSRKTHIAYIQTAGVTYGKLQSITKGYLSPTDAVVTTYNYDVYGRLQTIQRGSKVLANYTTYNNRNLAIASIDSNGLEFHYLYDNLDRITNVYYPWAGDPTPSDWSDHPQDQYVYCNCGSLTDVINRAGQKTSYAYNSMDRLWKVYEANHTTTPHVSEYLYDGVGRLQQINAPGINLPGATLTTWSYDDTNNVSTKAYPDGNYEQWTADGQGNLTSYRNARNETASYSYDKNSRLTAINYVSAPDVTFVHDTINLKTTMTDGAGTTTWEYDTAGRLLSENGPWANSKVSYTYDDAGRSETRQSQVTSTQNDTVTYTYESAIGRLTKINFAAHGGSYDYNYAYNNGGFGLLDSLTRAAGGTNLTQTQFLNRDDLLRPQQISHLRFNNTQPVFAQYQYTFGGTGADTTNYGLRDVVTSKYSYLPSFVSATNYYGYDDFDQLTRVFSGNYSLEPHQTTAYDPSGNRQSVRTDDPGTVTTTYTTNNLNQYTGRSNPSATETYFYDAAGNRITVKLGGVTQTSYITNETGNLIRYNSYNNGVNQYQSQFLYDGIGRLRQVQDYSWIGGTWSLQTTTRFVYSGGLIVQERDASNTVTARNVWGPSLGGGIGGLLGRSTQEGAVWKHFNYYCDATGNVGQVTEASGPKTLAASYFYDSWGNIKSDAALTQDKQPYRYSSKWTHSVSGLVYFGARWYDTNVGRFVNRDPIGEAGGQNLYAYVSNSPTNRVDPWGFQWSCGEGMEEVEPGVCAMSTGGGGAPTPGYVGGDSGGFGSGISSWFGGVANACRNIGRSIGRSIMGSGQEVPPTPSPSGAERVRNHFRPEDFSSVQENMWINESGQGGVHVERQPFGPVNPSSARDRLGGEQTKGAWVEFDMFDSDPKRDTTNQVGWPSCEIKLPGISLVDRNPTFGKYQPSPWERYIKGY